MAASNLRNLYTSAAKSNLGNLFGNWDPTAPIKLGDYGLLHGDWFERLGSLSEFGVTWTEQNSGTGKAHHKFVSSSKVETTLTAMLQVTI